MGIGFKKRKVELNKLEKTLTILDSTTNEIKDVYEIVDEVKEITLKDEKDDKYSEMQLKDMSFMNGLRDMYPDMKDMETVLTDACKSHKLLKDEKNKQLTDEQKEIEKEKLDKIAKSDEKTAKLLLDEANKVKEAEKNRQNEIEEAERTRHAAAQK